MAPGRFLRKCYYCSLVVLLIFINESTGNLERTLEKRILRCAVYNNPPYEIATRGLNGTITWKGGTIMAQEWYSKRLGFLLEYVTPHEEQIKLHGVEAVVDMVTRKETDYVGGGLVVTPARLEVVDPGTYIAWEDTYRLIVPIPAEEDRLLAFIRPFDSTVWLLLVVSLLVTVVTFSFISWAHHRFIVRCVTDQSFRRYVDSYFFYSINVLTNHGDYLKLTYISSFLVCATVWLFGASIIVYGYSCIVVSSLTIPKMKPMVNSFQDLIQSEQVSILVRSDAVMGQLILYNEAPIYRALRDKATRDSKSVITKNATLVNELLLKGKHAYAFVESFGRFFIATEYRKGGKCKNKLSKRIPTSINHFYQFFQKGSQFRRAFSRAAMELWETGQTRFWVNNEFPKADACFAPAQSNKPKQAAIKLEDLTSAFFILGVGFAISLFTFFSELVLKRISAKKRL